MKKKSLRKVLAASVAAMLMCAPMMAIGSVYADDPAYTITINTITNESKTEHTYAAYQIFKGKLSGGKLSDIEWGENIDDTKVIPAETGKTILEAVKGISCVVGGSSVTPFSSCTSAADIAEKLSGYSTADNEVAKAFADVVAKYKKGTPIKSTTAKDASENITGYSIGNITSAGYYLIEDAKSPVSGKDDVSSSKTRYILSVVDDVTITPKTKYPTLEKFVGTGKDDSGETTWGEANTASSTDIIEYKITSKVPDMTGYNKYYFIVNDTMSNGISYYTDDTHKMAITIGSTTLTDGTDYANFNSSAFNGDKGTYYVEKTSDQKFKIVFNKFIEWKDNTNEDIVITYYGKLNSNAVYGNSISDGNNNKADLTYSNDPNVEYGNGKPAVPDSPDDDDTDPQEPAKPNEPSDSKHDDPDNPTPDNYEDDIPDEPTATTPEDVVYTYTAKLKVTKVKPDPTDDDPNKTSPLNGAGFTLYKKNDSGNYVAVGTEIKNTTGNEFVFTQLKEGDYKLVESTVPDGYNKAADLTFKITGTINDQKGCTWADDSDAVSLNVSEFSTTVINNEGSILPSTGGIGTTIFYVSGGVLVLGSVVLIITKKRMSLKDEK